MDSACTCGKPLGRLRPIADPAPILFEGNPNGRRDLRSLFHVAIVPPSVGPVGCSVSLKSEQLDP
jgi:hypothetical protein